MKRLLPKEEIVSGDLVAVLALAELLRVVRFEEGADLIAEGHILGGELKIHGATPGGEGGNLPPRNDDYPATLFCHALVYVRYVKGILPMNARSHCRYGRVMRYEFTLYCPLECTSQ